MRSGTNRYNTPTVYGGGQRYRATRQYPRTDYHAPRQNSSPNRVDSSAYRVNTRLYP